MKQHEKRECSYNCFMISYASPMILVPRVMVLGMQVRIIHFRFYCSPRRRGHFEPQPYGSNGLQWAPGKMGKNNYAMFGHFLGHLYGRLI